MSQIITFPFSYPVARVEFFTIENFMHVTRFYSEKEIIDLYESLRLATVMDPSVDADASYASD